GKWVGRFERDSARQFGVGCSWAYLLGGGILVFIAPPAGALCLGAAILLFLVGYRAARKSLGQRDRLLAAGKCLFCEYDLVGLGSAGTCPECGQRFENRGLTADLSP